MGDPKTNKCGFICTLVYAASGKDGDTSPQHIYFLLAKTLLFERLCYIYKAQLLHQQNSSTVSSNRQPMDNAMVMVVYAGTGQWVSLFGMSWYLLSCRRHRHFPYVCFRSSFYLMLLLLPDSCAVFMIVNCRSLMCTWLLIFPGFSSQFSTFKICFSFLFSYLKTLFWHRFANISFYFQKSAILFVTTQQNSTFPVATQRSVFLK